MFQCSERALQAIEAREGSPAWLAEETRQLRKGMLALYRNRLLLPDAEGSGFFPVRTQHDAPAAGSVQRSSVLSSAMCRGSTCPQPAASVSCLRAGRMTCAGCTMTTTMADRTRFGAAMRSVRCQRCRCVLRNPVLVHPQMCSRPRQWRVKQCRTGDQSFRMHWHRCPGHIIRLTTWVASGLLQNAGLRRGFGDDPGLRAAHHGPLGPCW